MKCRSGITDRAASGPQLAGSWQGARLLNQSHYIISFLLHQSGISGFLYRPELSVVLSDIGRFHGNIRKAVLGHGSNEYKAYAEEHRRQPPPPQAGQARNVSGRFVCRAGSVLASRRGICSGRFERAAILSIPASSTPFGAAAGTKPATLTQRLQYQPELIPALHPRWNGMKALNQFHSCNLTSK